MSKWLDFPDQPGYWWRLHITYSPDGFHGAHTPDLVRVTELQGDVAVDGNMLVGRRPATGWRDRLDEEAQKAHGYPSRFFHPWRWLRVADIELKRDKQGRLDREIVWGSE